MMRRAGSLLLIALCALVGCRAYRDGDLGAHFAADGGARDREAGSQEPGDDDDGDENEDGEFEIEAR